MTVSVAAGPSRTKVAKGRKAHECAAQCEQNAKGTRAKSAHPLRLTSPSTRQDNKQKNKRVCIGVVWWCLYMCVHVKVSGNVHNKKKEWVSRKELFCG